MEDKYKQTVEVYEKLGKKYLKQINPFKVMGIEKFIKMIPKGGRILDVGCAGGRDSKIFVNKGFKVIGIDVVDFFIKEAKKNVPKAKFIKMDIRKLKFSKGSFDAIWANAILLHLDKKDIPAVLKNFYKILKSGGTLHIRMKEGKGRKEVAEKITFNKKRIFTYISKPELEKLVKKSGFAIIQSKLFPDQLKRSDVKWVGVLAEKE